MALIVVSLVGTGRFLPTLSLASGYFLLAVVLTPTAFLYALAQLFPKDF